VNLGLLVASAIAVFTLLAASPGGLDRVYLRSAPLGAGHVLGTDGDGRDLFARLLFALRTSLGIAVLAAAIAAAIGAVVAKLTEALSSWSSRCPLCTLSPTTCGTRFSC
jgi:peptide/nickel transport system permease protein